MIKKFKIIIAIVLSACMLLSCKSEESLRATFYVKNVKSLDGITFHIDDKQLYVNAYDKITYLGKSEYIRSGLPSNRLPEIICYDELKDEFYYDIYYFEQNGDRVFSIHKLKIDEKGEVKEGIKDEVRPEKDVLFNIEYMRYLGDVGKYPMYVTRDFRLYTIRDNKTELVDDIGNDGWDVINQNYIDSTIAINSFDKKLYYLKDVRIGDLYDRLYMINENLEKSVIADNVKGFVAMQNEVFYVTDALYRYKNNRSERVMDAYDVAFAGKHNSTKCYMNVLEEVPLSDKFYIDKETASDEEKLLYSSFINSNIFKKSLYLYENGEFIKVSNAENVFIVKDWLTKKTLGKDIYLAFEVDAGGEKINFHNFYESLTDWDKKDNYRVRQKAENAKGKSKCYAMILDGYDIYRTEVSADNVCSEAEELIINDGYARYKYNTETFEIFYGNNVDKKEKRVKEVKEEDNYNKKELEIVRLTNHLN